MRSLPLLVLIGLIFNHFAGPGHPHGEGFTVSCSKCHSSKGWQLDRSVYSFDHNTTRMPLQGQHASADCRKCHISLIFSSAKSSCSECHKDVHQTTVGFDCSRCHTPASWLVNNVTEIHQRSRFPLLGAHRNADCMQCHKSESLAKYDALGVNCIDCHRENYLSTANPNHTDAGFSEDCSSCHPVNSFQWTGAGFNHNFFPLVQSHAGPKCADCHKTAIYSDANPECNSCHNTDYLATTNPSHSASKFPVTCNSCHSLSPGWKPATFNHNFFPLTLGHATPQCIDCHAGGNYTTTPTECYGCHQANYNNAVNPNHKTLNFSTLCTQCHTTNPDWKPASFTQHDSQAFPIYTGRHKGTWTTCAQCHPNAANYSDFTCLSCHEHNKSSMDSEHSGRTGYSYTSSACLHCHPTGKAD
jgi:nitrate/TMAO reductase-like tetraheme cytochrome c subunit